MSMPYDLSAEERARRRYYFVALPAFFCALFVAMAIGFRWLPPRFRDWPAITLLASGLAIAEAWSAQRGWRTIAGELLLGAFIAAIWVWWRGSF